jgi:PTS system nitrogen regulatory IIA component
MSDKQSTPLLIPERVKFQKKIESKKCVFDALTKLLEKGQSEVNRNEIFDAFIAREKLGDTYIGSSIALPRAHVKITNPRAALLVLKKGLNLNTADKQNVRAFLAVLVPENEQDQYSVILSDISKKLIKEQDFDKIINSENPDLVAQYFDNLF